MKIAFSCDHAGYPWRDAIIRYLSEEGHIVVDLSPEMYDELDDFPGFAESVARSLLDGRAERGVLVCGTGIGMSIAANRYPGIRAVLAYSPEVAQISRTHNDANVICFGARTMNLETALSSIGVFLSTDFLGGKYQSRNQIIDGEYLGI